MALRSKIDLTVYLGIINSINNVLLGSYMSMVVMAVFRGGGFRVQTLPEMSSVIKNIFIEFPR